MSVLRCIPFFLFLLLTGCEPQIREYEVPASLEAYRPSDLLRDAFDVVPFRWKVPETWKDSENDQFSAFAWETGSAGQKARVTVSPLEQRAGLEQQFVRWRGQVGLAPVEPAEAMKDVETLLLDGLSGEWAEYVGESETILGMIVPYQGKLWVFKLRASNAAAEEQKKAFRSFCESLTVT